MEGGAQHGHTPFGVRPCRATSATLVRKQFNGMGSAMSSKTKTTFHPAKDTEQSEGAGVILCRRTPGRHLRVAVFSWSVLAGDEHSQSPEELCDSLTGGTERCGPCDLIVTAGLPVNAELSAKTILDSSHGFPVLFESHSGHWLLAHQDQDEPQITMLRRRQIVSRYDQRKAFSQLAEIIASGSGVIEFAHTDLKLVLFICGENNLLQSQNNTSVLKSGPDGMRLLSTILGHRWAVLNSAHRAYFPQIRSTGFAKVGSVGTGANSAGPTLRKLVESKKVFCDGTRSPIATIHVNNYRDDKPKTQRFSAVGFLNEVEGDCRMLGPFVGTLTNRSRTWRCSVIELPT